MGTTSTSLLLLQLLKSLIPSSKKNLPPTPRASSVPNPAPVEAGITAISFPVKAPRTGISHYQGAADSTSRLLTLVGARAPPCVALTGLLRSCGLGRSALSWMLSSQTRRTQDLREGDQGSYLSQASLPGVQVATGDFAGADKEITSFPHARDVAPNAASFGALRGLHPEHLWRTGVCRQPGGVADLSATGSGQGARQAGDPRGPRELSSAGLSPCALSFHSPDPRRSLSRALPVLHPSSAPCPPRFSSWVAAAVASGSRPSPSRPAGDPTPPSPAQRSGTAPRCPHVALSSRRSWELQV